MPDKTLTDEGFTNVYKGLRFNTESILDGSKIQRQDCFPDVVISPFCRNHHQTGRPMTKPEIVHDYNKFMGAVDRCDQMVAYSCFRRRTMKWWKKVFFHLFSLTILNAYILYKERTRSLVLHRTFRRELVKELIRSSGISPLTPRSEESKEVSRRFDTSSSWK